MEYLEKLDYSFFQYIEQRLATSSQKNLAYELKVSKARCLHGTRLLR